MTQATYLQAPLWFSRHATPDYAPQYGVYIEGGDGSDIAIVKGDDAENYAKLFAAAPALRAALIDAQSLLRELRAHDLDDEESRATMAEIAWALEQAAPTE